MVLFLLKLILALLTDKLLKLLFELGGLVTEIVLETVLENILAPPASDTSALMLTVALPKAFALNVNVITFLVPYNKNLLKP